MELRDIICGRRSVRRFTDKGVTRDSITNLIELATYAPNAGNQQTWRFIAIDKKEVLEEMKGVVDGVIGKLTGEEVPPGKITYQNLFAKAPVTIVAVMRPYESHMDRVLKEKSPERYRIRQEMVNPSLQSISAAIAQMLLAAHEMGLGSCWMTGPLTARAELEGLIGIKPPEEIAALIALGYPSKIPECPKRKRVEEVLTFI